MSRTLSLLAATALGMPAYAQTAPAPEPVVTAGDGSADRAVPQSDATATARGDDSDAVLQSYPPAYFAQFQPVTALDMIRQVPGFSLQGGGGGARGFGEASANFLINGRRPSTKGQDAGDLLGRIQAESVIRIELLDGASLDIPGLSGQVVNVVARAVEFSGNYRYAARFEEGTRPQLLEGSVNLTGETGNLAFALALNAGQFSRSEDGTEFFATDAPRRGGTIIEDRQEFVTLDNRRPSASLNLSWTRDNGHEANLNTRVQRPNNSSNIGERFTALTPEGNTGQSFGRSAEDEWEAEVSGDYALPVGPGTLKFIGLYRYEDSDFDTRFVAANTGDIPVRTIFARRDKEGETIARAEYAFKPLPAHDVQVSAEYAFNYLDSVTQFENNFIAPVIDEVRVEEDRIDVRLTDSWTVSDALAVQASVGAENSELGVVGPNQEPRSFFRPKGYLGASYKLDDTYTVRGRVERRVGQLNFGTFVSTRSLTDDRVNTGNDDIVPQQFWDTFIEIERVDTDLLSGSVRAEYTRVDDPIDRRLFADGTDGPGNLDTAAEIWGISADATLLMDTLGVPGLRLEAEAGIFDSSLEDPLTFETRRLNGQTEWEWELEGRYDIPGTSIALTAEIEDAEFARDVRFDEIQAVSLDAPELDAGIIFKDISGLQLTVRVQNILDAATVRERERFFTDERRLGPIGLFERFERRRGRRLNISLEGTF